MYEIFSDDIRVYAPGDITNRSVMNPIYSHELGKAGELTFIVPPNVDMHKGVDNYQLYQKLISTIYLKKNGKVKWSGRVLHDEKDFYGNRNAYCEGRLAWLNDNVAYAYSYGYGVATHGSFNEDPYNKPGKVTLQEFFDLIVFLINRHQFPNKEFKKGQMTVVPKTNETKFSFRSKEYKQAWEELEEKLVNDERFGGYFSIHYDGPDGKTPYLDYLEKDTGREISQRIVFGENLLDINEFIDTTEMFTIIVPLGDTLETKDGEEQERLTIRSVNDNYAYWPKGEDWNNNTPEAKLVREYGAIARTVVFDGIKDPNVLLQKAKEYLKTAKLVDTITLTAVDLELLGIEEEAIELGDLVWIVSPPHNIFKKIQCTKVEIDLDNPQNNRYTFGFIVRGLTDAELNKKKQTGEDEDDMALLFESWDTLYPRTDAEISAQSTNDNDTDDDQGD